MSTGINPKVEATQNIFKSLVYDNFINYLLTLAKSVPWLSPLMFILTPLIRYVSDKAYKYFVLFFDVQAIKIMDNKAQSHYEQESIKLYIIAHEKGINSNEFIKSREVAAIAQSKFTMFHF